METTLEKHWNLPNDNITRVASVPPAFMFNASDPQGEHETENGDLFVVVPVTIVVTERVLL